MLDLSANCPQCDHWCGDYLNERDLSSVKFDCDDCGAEFTASFDVIFDKAELITRGTNHDDEIEVEE